MGSSGRRTVVDPPGFFDTGDIVVGAGTEVVVVDQICTLTRVRASLGVAPTGSAATIIVKKNSGATVATVNLPAGAGVVTAYVDVSVALVAGDYLTCDVTAVGSTTPGTSLTVQLKLR